MGAWHETVAAMSDAELRTAVSLGNKNLGELRLAINTRTDAGIALGSLPAQLDDVWAHLRVAEAEARRRANVPKEDSDAA